MTTQDPADWIGLVKVGVDRFKPTHTQLLAEGVSRPAVETLLIARDGISCGSTADEIAGFLRASQEAYPIAVEDVWPTGTPAHWLGRRAS